MTPRNQLSPLCVDAKYVSSRIPQFSGNPLIEALPPALNPEEALTAFASAPSFSVGQREWSVVERLQMLKTLSTFMTPLERHVSFSMELDSMLRNGLVGRAPATAEYVKRTQSIYEIRLDRNVADDSDVFSDSHPLSLLLMGLSGMGKTQFVKRWAQRYPKVIYHSHYNVYQIPVLHIELPSDGESVKGLCNAILKAVDKLIPGANYVQAYALRGRPSAELLILHVETVLNMHCVGMLICDEVQNLTNAGKNKGRLMTELVSMSNILSIPLVFIGTNKSERLFGLDFRKTRRVSGFGSQHWDRLQESQSLDDGRVISEWRDFVEFLWQFQWTKTATPLTEELLQTLYWCSQGVIDTAIKMFAAAQARAILYGTEEITKDLLMDVYKADFTLLHPMLDALRRNDLKALSNFEDIQPLSMHRIIDSMEQRARSLKSPALTLTPSTANFVSHVANALHATGFPLPDALAAANEAASGGKAKNLVEAVRMATDKLTPHASPKRAGSSGKKKVKVEEDYSNRPNDLRRYLQYAQRSGRDVIDVMQQSGVFTPLEDILELT